MVNMEELVKKARELKPLPASAVRLASLTSSMDTDLAEISDIIVHDQALTMRLLRAANSAASGSAMVITDAQDAVFRLGTARVLALTIAANVNTLLKRDDPALRLSESKLWSHSIAAAAAAESLPEFVSISLPPESFTSALLHDIGKLVMGRFLTPQDLEAIQKAQTDDGIDSLQAEKKVLGGHHGELGGIIAQHWKLPESISRGIIYHHTPKEGADPICDAVYLSNIIAKHIEDELAPPTPDLEALERLGLTEQQLEKLTDIAKNRFKVVHARYTN